MKQPNEMTLNECRNELASLAGWRIETVDYNWLRGPGPLWTIEQGTFSTFHPIPPTLDAIAGAMPEGWTWGIGRQCKFGGSGLEWLWWAELEAEPHTTVSVPRTGDEKLDRARLAVACWRATRGS